MFFYCERKLLNHPGVCPAATSYQLTVSSISLVWAAETQKRALDSMMGVAGKPTTTVPMFLFTISRPKALKRQKHHPRSWFPHLKLDALLGHNIQSQATHPILAGMYSIRGTTGESSLP